MGQIAASDVAAAFRELEAGPLDVVLRQAASLAAKQEAVGSIRPGAGVGQFR